MSQGRMRTCVRAALDVLPLVGMSGPGRRLSVAAATLATVMAFSAAAAEAVQYGGAAAVSLDASGTGGAEPTPPASGGDPATAAPADDPKPTVTLAKANLRTTPGGGKVLRKLAKGTAVDALCTQVGGLVVTKRDGPSRVWVKVRAGKRVGFVHDVLVNPSTGRLIAKLCAGATTAALPVGQGACGIKPPVDLIAPFKKPQDFIDAVLPGARESWDDHQVPVSVTLAQAILETGAGTSSALGNNYFGIKARATGTKGQFSYGPNAAGCTLVKTREAESAGLVLTVGAFRAYEELRTSVLDHGDLLRSNPVYAPAFKYTKQPKKFLREIAKRYATDPAYADKLLSLVSRYNLLKYDE